MPNNSDFHAIDGRQNDYEMAMDNLQKNQGQLDQDGILVSVSRQALGQVFEYIEALNYRVKTTQMIADSMKREAEQHSQEARTQKATVHEIYQMISGAAGEPGDWHGAEPVRKFIADISEQIAEHEQWHQACVNGFEQIALAAGITLDAPEAMAYQIAAAISNARFKRDALMKSVSVNWFPREISQGKFTPDLMTGFIWGTDRPELAGFVQSVREGELAVAMFDGNAKLIYSEAEPNNIQVVISADRKVLEFLIVLMGLNGKALNADIIKQVREYAAAQGESK